MGEPRTAIPVTAAVIERFWNNLPDRPVGDCWVWQGDQDNASPPYGYLKFGVDGETYYVRAHRLSYFIAHGEWPLPRCLHDCRPNPDNRLCCNPDHLRAGTVADNNRDQSVKGVANNQFKGQPLCPRGHAWTASNTIWRIGKGGVFKECRACAKRRKARYRFTHPK